MIDDFKMVEILKLDYKSKTYVGKTFIKDDCFHGNLLIDDSIVICKSNVNFNLKLKLVNLLRFVVDKQPHSDDGIFIKSIGGFKHYLN